MSEHAKIKPSHLSRIAIVYVRQSSAAQVEHNRESTARQYALTQRAAALGWSADRVTVIDEDLGLSGASDPSAQRLCAHDRRSGAGRTWASSSGWRSRAWRATTPTGIACSTCAR